MSPKLNLPELESAAPPIGAAAATKLELSAAGVTAAERPGKLDFRAGGLEPQARATKLAALGEAAVSIVLRPEKCEFQADRLDPRLLLAKLDGPAEPEFARPRHDAKFELNDLSGAPSATLAARDVTKMADLTGGATAKAGPAKYGGFDLATLPAQEPHPAKAAVTKSPEIRVETRIAAPVIVAAPATPSASSTIRNEAPRPPAPAVLPPQRIAAAPAVPLRVELPKVAEAPAGVPQIVFAQVEWVAVSEAAAGTRPRGVAPEDTAKHVRSMFERIAPRYDFCNRVLSFGYDRRWRQRATRLLAERLPAVSAGAGQRRRTVLDVCCGTGDLALALTRRLPSLRVAGADFSRGMLTRARHKARGRAAQPVWFEADALHLPCADGSVAALTTAFGFRNLADYQAALREFWRVLQPGGALAILEFSRPRAPLFRQAYGFYFRFILPLVGGLLSGSRAPYRYLPESVGRFPHAEGLAQWMRTVGFERVEFRRFTFGIAVVHLANKPSN